MFNWPVLQNCYQNQRLLHHEKKNAVNWREGKRDCIKWLPLTGSRQSLRSLRNLLPLKAKCLPPNYMVSERNLALLVMFVEVMTNKRLSASCL